MVDRGSGADKYEAGVAKISRTMRSQGRRRRWHREGGFQVQDRSKDLGSQRGAMGR